MTQFSLAELFAMTIRESANDGSDFTNPSADFRRLFLGEDGSLHLKDSSGTVTTIGGGAAPDLAAARITRTNVGSNITVASTTWQDMDSTNLSITETTGARRCLLVLSGRLTHSAGNAYTRFGFSIDGTAVYTEAAGSSGVAGVRSETTGSEGFCITFLTDVLSAGSHTFRPRWNVSVGTTTAQQTASSDFLTFSVHELYAT